MKRKSIALLVALTMCLSLLSACGGNSAQNTGEPTTSDSTPETTEQQPADEQKEQPSQEPEQTEPEESEEPTQEPEPENNAGTEFLALLQEEWNNGFVEGEGPRRTYFNNRKFFLLNGVVYILGDMDYSSEYVSSYYTYNIATKEFSEAISPDVRRTNDQIVSFMDGNHYYMNCGWEEQNEIKFGCIAVDSNSAVLNSCAVQSDWNTFYAFFEKGILAVSTLDNSIEPVFLSYDLEKIADIPYPQKEIEHGLTEPVYLWFHNSTAFAADGTLYVKADSSLYRLNTDTCEWENIGSAPSLGEGTSFWGKYLSWKDGVYDRVTGEQVFEYGELYPAVNNKSGLCYFGGDKYLGCKNNEYRWVSLTDLSMSDPLPFPEGKDVVVLNDTYCAYEDSYYPARL